MSAIEVLGRVGPEGPSLFVLYTGGTFGMGPGPAGSLVPLDLREIRDHLSFLRQLPLALTVATFADPIDSSAMGPPDWVDIIAQSSPEYVDGVVAVATNSTSTADLGLFGPLNMVVGAGYILGGLVFGIALFRAGILARWAAALLAVAAVTTLAPLLVPMADQRLFAVPNGIAMIGLGWSLWREQRSTAAEPVSSTTSARLDPAGAR